ncbi:hypothetical protein AMECASPLE_032159 [Ameca splendens]|uniref:Uncharacterized protein n=1 Tax=Ameca splendens TaxID=208324 RepID=A0ABV0XJF5_9TELE
MKTASESQCTNSTLSSVCDLMSINMCLMETLLFLSDNTAFFFSFFQSMTITMLHFGHAHHKTVLFSNNYACTFDTISCDKSKLLHLQHIQPADCSLEDNCMAIIRSLRMA